MSTPLGFVCIKVNVTEAEGRALDAWVERRRAAGVTVDRSDVLRRCVQAVVRDEPALAGAERVTA